MEVKREVKMGVKKEVKMEVKMENTQYAVNNQNYRPASNAGFTSCA